MQGVPAGLPSGMPGIGLVIEGAMQQAPQLERQVSVWQVISELESILAHEASDKKPQPVTDCGF